MYPIMQQITKSLRNREFCVIIVRGPNLSYQITVTIKILDAVLGVHCELKLQKKICLSSLILKRNNPLANAHNNAYD